MSELFDRIEKHDPAFPVTVEAAGSRVTDYGMSRRDYFAAAALTGILAAVKGGWAGPDSHSKLAYKYADAMLAAGKVGP